MNSTERIPYLEAADAALTPLGFKRKKTEHEWRRNTDRDVEWIHLNFGLGVINPSYGVSYADLNSLLPVELGVRCGPSCMLQSLVGRSYSSTTSTPTDLALDLQKAVCELPKLRDRGAFTDVLMSEQAPATQVLLFSSRIRALPILLATSGRLPEAVDWLQRFEALAPERDRLIPGYSVYVADFKKKFVSQTF